MPFSRQYVRWREQIVQTLLERSAKSVSLHNSNPAARPVHLFQIPRSFSRLLKFSLNIWHASEDCVERLKNQVDEEITSFISLMGGGR